MYIRYSSEDAELTIGYLNLYFRGNVEAGYTNLTVIGIEMAFNIKRMEEITRE